MFDIIKGIVNSEKTANFQSNLIAFNVDKKANKKTIAHVLNTIFKDNKVVSVKTLNEKPYKKNFRGKSGYVSAYKKAYVKFKEGNIDINALVLE
jgi:large subunit ribosomal protein L23